MTKGILVQYMNPGCIRRIFTWEHLLLLLILALGYYMTLIPHLADPYPVHLDEWVHIASSNQIINQGTVTELVDPFTGGPPIFNQRIEAGYHVFLGIFREVSGVSWFDIPCRQSVILVAPIPGLKGYCADQTWYAVSLPPPVDH